MLRSLYDYGFVTGLAVVHIRFATVLPKLHSVGLASLVSFLGREAEIDDVTVTDFVFLALQSYFSILAAGGL